MVTAVEALLGYGYRVYMLPSSDGRTRMHRWEAEEVTRASIKSVASKATPFTLQLVHSSVQLDAW
jgi:hypothetical protein